MTPAPEHRPIRESKEECGPLVDYIPMWPLHQPAPSETAAPPIWRWCLAETELSVARRSRFGWFLGEGHRGPDIDLLVDFLQEQETPFATWIRTTLQGVLARSIVELTGASQSDSASMRAVRAQVEQLEHKIEELVGELRQRPVISSVTLLDLGIESLALAQPVQIVIQQYDEEVTASWPETEAFGSGSSPSEAILALKRDIVALYSDLQSTPDEELGALSLVWKRALRRVVVPNGTSERQTA